MSKKIYVGNLPYTMREDDLSQFFAEMGEVQSVRIITDRDSGRSKGFGFVEMSEEAAATKAISELNGKELEGRTIVVNEARSNDGGGGGGGGGGRSFNRKPRY